MQFFQSLLRSANNVVLKMGTDEWAVVGVTLVVLGFFTLRGFSKNSRL